MELEICFDVTPYPSPAEDRFPVLFIKEVHISTAGWSIPLLKHRQDVTAMRAQYMLSALAAIVVSLVKADGGPIVNLGYVQYQGVTNASLG
jgi:hypothetical protein